MRLYFVKTGLLVLWMYAPRSSRAREALSQARRRVPFPDNVFFAPPQKTCRSLVENLPPNLLLVQNRFAGLFWAYVGYVRDWYNFPLRRPLPFRWEIPLGVIQGKQRVHCYPVSTEFGAWTAIRIKAL
jgi:hypothetical protein